MAASADDIGLLARHGWEATRNRKEDNIMRTTSKYRVALLVAAVIAGPIALAPIASADTDPQVPYGTDPYVPYGPQTQQSPDVFGYHPSNHDEINTTNGQTDRPF
jgi:hypothetical protein